MFGLMHFHKLWKQISGKISSKKSKQYNFTLGLKIGLRFNFSRLQNLEYIDSSTMDSFKNLQKKKKKIFDLRILKNLKSQTR